MQRLDFVDSNVLIRGSRALRRSDEGADDRATAYVEDLKEQPGELPKAAVPAIVVAEVLAGLDTAERRRIAMETVFSHLAVIPFDLEAAHRYTELWAGARSGRKGQINGRECAHVDAMIAATAIAKNGARIVTCNTADFQFVTQFIEVIEPPPLARQDPISF